MVLQKLYHSMTITFANVVHIDILSVVATIGLDHECHAKSGEDSRIIIPMDGECCLRAILVVRYKILL